MKLLKRPKKIFKCAPFTRSVVRMPVIYYAYTRLRVHTELRGLHSGNQKFEKTRHVFSSRRSSTPNHSGSRSRKAVA